MKYNILFLYIQVIYQNYCNIFISVRYTVNNKICNGNSIQKKILTQPMFTGKLKKIILTYLFIVGKYDKEINEIVSRIKNILH